MARVDKRREQPLLAAKGRQAFYASNDAKVVSVAIKPGNSFEAGVPRPLFDIATVRSHRG
jgi:hypothetical protein